MTLVTLTAMSATPAGAQSCNSLQSQLASARRGSGNRAEYRRYAEAAARGFFDGEIVPVEVPAGRKGEKVPVARDEHPQPETTV